MTPRYHFSLKDDRDTKMYGDAHTLLGVKRVFKKVSQSRHCDVYKRRINGNCPSDPFITLHK